MALPPSTPGTCLNWTRADAVGHRGRRLRAGPPVRAGRHRARWPTRPTLPDDGRWRQLVRERCDPVVKQLPERPVRPGRPLPGRRAQALASEVGRRATGSCGAACRARRAPARCYPIAGTAAEQDQSGGARPGHLPGDQRAHDRRPRRLHAAARRRGGRGRRPGEEVRRRQVPGRRRAGRVPADRVHEGRHRVRGQRRRDRREEAHRLLGQPHRGLLEGGHPQGQLQPGHAAARPQRLRADDRLGQAARSRWPTQPAPPATNSPSPASRRRCRRSSPADARAGTRPDGDRARHAHAAGYGRAAARQHPTSTPRTTDPVPARTRRAPVPPHCRSRRSPAPGPGVARRRRG